MHISILSEVQRLTNISILPLDIFIKNTVVKFALVQKIALFFPKEISKISLGKKVFELEFYVWRF